ncbi:hypothetical protein STEG23_002474 [Scotinomys teguina]
MASGCSWILLVQWHPGAPESQRVACTVKTITNNKLQLSPLNNGNLRIATPACFLSPFDWKVFSQPFTLSDLIIICSLREFFISSLRASITFCKSFLVMNSASSVLVCSGLAVGEPIGFDGVIT